MRGLRATVIYVSIFLTILRKVNLASPKYLLIKLKNQEDSGNLKSKSYKCERRISHVMIFWKSQIIQNDYFLGVRCHDDDECRDLKFNSTAIDNLCISMDHIRKHCPIMCGICDNEKSKGKYVFFIMFNSYLQFNFLKNS